MASDGDAALWRQFVKFLHNHAGAPSHAAGDLRMTRDLTKIAKVKNSPKRIAALNDYLLEQAEELEGMAPGMLEGPQLRPAAVSQLELLEYVIRRPDSAQCLQKRLNRLKEWKNRQLANEFSVCLGLERIPYGSLLRAGYSASDLETLMMTIPLRSPLGRIGFTSEILATIDEEIIGNLRRRGMAKNSEAQQDQPANMRGAKRRLKAFAKSLNSFVEAVSSKSDEVLFIQKAFRSASGDRSGRYRSPKTQLGWLRRRATIFQIEIEHILENSPMRGRPTDTDLSAELGDQVESSLHLRIALRLGRAWLEWLGKPPTRITGKKDAGRADGVLNSVPDGAFLKIVSIVVNPVAARPQTFDAAVRKVVASLSAEFRRYGQ